LETSDLKRLRELEEKNKRRKHTSADYAKTQHVLSITTATKYWNI
jgi:hypothetical protein